MRPFGCISVNCLNRLKFLPEISVKLQKIHFLRQFQDHNSGRHILYHGKKHFCCYFLQGFSSGEMLKHHIKDCFKINGKQRIIILKMVNILYSEFMKENKVTVNILCRF